MRQVCCVGGGRGEHIRSNTIMGLDIDEDVVVAICLAETVLYCVRRGGEGGGDRRGAWWKLHVMGLDIDEDVVHAICLTETETVVCFLQGGGGGGGGMMEATS